MRRTVRGGDRVGNAHMLKRAEGIGQSTMVTSSEICLHLWGSNHHRCILKLASLMRLSNSHICIVISSEMGIDNHASNEFVVLDHTSMMGITSEMPLVEMFLWWDLSSGTWIDEMALSDQCYSWACLHEQHYQRCFWFTHISNLTSAACFVLVSTVGIFFVLFWQSDESIYHCLFIIYSIRITFFMIAIHGISWSSFWWWCS